MLRKIAFLAMAIAATSALAAPALASATTTEWTKNGATLTTNDVVHFEGTAKFESETLGAVHCPAGATATVTLGAGTHNATVTQFTHATPASCHVGGFLGSVCGTNSLTKVNLLKNANATGTLNGQVHVTGIQLLNEFGTCLSLVLTGGVTATFDSTTAATEAALSGKLDTGGFGEVNVSGSLGITQSGVYGISTF